MARATLLLVDDDPLIRGSLGEVLKIAGYDVIQASSGAEALQILPKADVDLVITDFNMPEVNGLELLSEIKRQKPEVPVILVTGYGTVEQAVDAMKSGAFDYVSKPIMDDEMKARHRPRARRQEPADGEHRAEEASGPALRPRRDRRPQQPDAEDLRHDRERRRDAGDRAHHRRVRDGQDPDRPRAAPQQQPQGPVVRTRSTAAPCPRRCSTASCSATSAVRSPARTPTSSVSSPSPTRARSSWTR